MLVSACGACQNRTWIDLAAFDSQCPTNMKSDDGVYPGVIDNRTAVPHWAYIKINDTGGDFNTGLASLAGGLYQYFVRQSRSV
jgi:hypothetical protein